MTATDQDSIRLKSIVYTYGLEFSDSKEEWIWMRHRLYQCGILLQEDLFRVEVPSLRIDNPMQVGLLARIMISGFSRSTFSFPFC